MRQVNQLETELGFKLFFRTRKGCTLTPDGNAFYQKAKQILVDLDGLIAESKQKTASEMHPLRIGLYKPYDLMEMLEEYKTQHPDQVVEYDAYESYDADHHADWMKSHNLDILQVGYSPSLTAQGLAFSRFTGISFAATSPRTLPSLRTKPSRCRIWQITASFPIPKRPSPSANWRSILPLKSAR